MRLFIPATLSMLETLVAEGRMPVRSATAFAATAALVESYTHGDLEEIEHIAFLEAARASIRLLAAEDDAGGGESERVHRRVVLSVDLPDDRVEPRPDLDTAVVRISPSEVTAGELAAVHVDLSGAASAVRAAVEVIDRADLGDEDAELTVGDAEDLDLAWYDPVELPFLLSML